MKETFEIISLDSTYTENSIKYKLVVILPKKFDGLGVEMDSL